nr:ribonuclease domain-containing protein [uncultured Acetatifactor sp.]
MKKFSRLLFTFFLAFALSACGNLPSQESARPDAVSAETAGTVSEPDSPEDDGLSETAEASRDGAGDETAETSRDGAGDETAEASRDSAGDETAEASRDGAGDETEEASSESEQEETSQDDGNVPENSVSGEESLPEDGTYTAKDDVALYIHQYGKLPPNFITKKEAEKLGWEGGSLEPYAPGKCIGGSRFGNYEGLLPEAEGRVYTECDIDTLGKQKRGAKRIVFSNDGLIYYTEDHYESFELLYGEE